jgi:hypothetical protein
MTTDRKKPGVAFWATVALVPMLLYVASFGPAWWLGHRQVISARQIRTGYRPILELM